MADDDMGFMMMAFGTSSGGSSRPIQDLRWQGLCLGPNKGLDAQDKPHVPGMVFHDRNYWQHGGPVYVFMSAPEIDARLAKNDYWDNKCFTGLSLAIGQSSLRLAVKRKTNLHVVTAEELASSDVRFLDKLQDTPADYHRRQDVLMRREGRQAAREANPPG